ncbi:GNAT family N-acetyltransferase [Lichenicola sp.]|uniref:GNAT family N-acetyltransferase n=1 Tax=Lichenicola sp. TaxID=2804529 RepID=UPI003B003C2A
MMASTPTPTLRTGRLILEPLRSDHAAEMFDGLSDPALYRYLVDLPPRSPAALQAQYREIASGLSPDGEQLWHSWAIRRKTDRRCIGTVQATIPLVGEHEQQALLGYMIFPAYWRQGSGREALSAMLDFLFDSAGCGRADALVDTRNNPSLALLDSLGFRTVGRIANADHFAGSTSHEYELSLDAAAWHGDTRT